MWFGVGVGKWNSLRKGAAVPEPVQTRTYCLQQAPFQLTWVTPLPAQPPIVDALFDANGDLAVIVVGEAPAKPNERTAVSRYLRQAMLQQAPLHEIIAEDTPPLCENLNLALLRFSHSVGRVELILAGLPPVVRCMKGLPTHQFPALSGAIRFPMQGSCAVQWIGLESKSHWLIQTAQVASQSEAVRKAVEEVADWVSRQEQAPAAGDLAECVARAAAGLEQPPLLATAVVSFGF